MISVLDKKFIKLLNKLSDEVRKITNEKYLLWKDFPDHPSLDFKELINKPNNYRIKIGDHYRAVGQLYKTELKVYIVWFWIGSHEDYNKFIKKL